jgi:hypothetical protein
MWFILQVACVMLVQQLTITKINTHFKVRSKSGLHMYVYNNYEKKSAN